jgi:hypothetical protein
MRDSSDGIDVSFFLFFFASRSIVEGTSGRTFPIIVDMATRDDGAAPSMTF